MRVPISLCSGIGFLASENPTLTDRVKPVLVTALKDRRRCVSGEAERALQVRQP